MLKPWSQSPAGKRFLSWFMVFGGLALVVGGFWFFHRNASFLDETARAPGTVVAVEGKRGARGQKFYYAVARFAVPGSAREVTFRSRTGLWPSPFDVGDRVEVAYDADRPERAEINSFWTMWFIPLLMVGFGVLCAVMGWLVLTGRIPTAPRPRQPGSG